MMDTPEELTAWVEELAEALGVQGDVPVAELLDVTREVAHQVTRPAGPITTYLVGCAQAQGMPVDEAVAVVRAKLTEQA
jgi:hypothetical protein